MKILKKIFCNHEYSWHRKIELYQCISGETQYLVCTKCGKIKDERFIKY